MTTPSYKHFFEWHHTTVSGGTPLPELPSKSAFRLWIDEERKPSDERDTLTQLYCRWAADYYDYVGDAYQRLIMYHLSVAIRICPESHTAYPGGLVHRIHRHLRRIGREIGRLCICDDSTD